MPVGWHECEQHWELVEQFVPFGRHDAAAAGVGVVIEVIIGTTIAAAAMPMPSLRIKSRREVIFATAGIEFDSRFARSNCARQLATTVGASLPRSCRSSSDSRSVTDL